jgi:hypothetical protein
LKKIPRLNISSKKIPRLNISSKKIPRLNISSKKFPRLIISSKKLAYKKSNFRGPSKIDFFLLKNACFTGFGAKSGPLGLLKLQNQNISKKNHLD